MDPNNNNSNPGGIVSRIRAALERFSLKKIHQPNQPYIPQPDQNSNDFFSSLGADTEHCEMEADIHDLSGTLVQFGTRKIVQIDKNGRAKDLSKGQSYRIGSNKIVSRIEDIAGICPICEVIALAEFQAGRIPLQQAQLASMYDKASAAKCDLCHRNICAAHCRPVQIEDATHNVCANCLQKLESQKRKKQILNFLLAPFAKTEDQQ